MLPFFSRRIGLDARGNPLRLDAGVKMTGRIGAWNMGVLGVRQDPPRGRAARTCSWGGWPPTCWPNRASERLQPAATRTATVTIPSPGSIFAI